MVFTWLGICVCGRLTWWLTRGLRRPTVPRCVAEPHTFRPLIPVTHIVRSEGVAGASGATVVWARVPLAGGASF